LPQAAGESKRRRVHDSALNDIDIDDQVPADNINNQARDATATTTTTKQQQATSIPVTTTTTTLAPNRGVAIPLSPTAAVASQSASDIDLTTPLQVLDITQRFRCEEDQAVARNYSVPIAYMSKSKMAKLRAAIFKRLQINLPDDFFQVLQVAKAIDAAQPCGM
jgi:hypothetical protein